MPGFLPDEFRFLYRTDQGRLDRAHWIRGAAPLHWPLVDAPGRMAELLGRQELERKRLEDGWSYLLTLPGYSP